MKVLITGGAGFIGLHLVERLLLESIDITVLDNFSTGRRENVPDSIHLIETDMKSPELSNLFRREKFDALIHLAAQTTVAYSIESPLDDAQENIIGTLNLLRASNDNGIERFIFASSAAIYGNVPEDFLPIREDMRPVPLSFYGLSKLTAEKYIELHHSTYGLNYIILRFSNVFGEKQGDSGEGGVISIFSKRIATTDRGGVVVFGDGRQTRDFIHVSDIADGIYSALKTDRVNAIYNISTQTEVDINCLLSTLATISRKKFDVEYAPARIGDIRRSSLSNERAISNLDWKPQISFEEGIARTYKYFLKKE